MNSIPVVLAIDVEPDETQVPRDRRPPWRGFERMVAAVAELRLRLADATGAPVRFNWFLRMDAQVSEAYGSATWVVQTYRDEIQELVAADDGFGLHPHTLRWLDPPGRWVADNAHPDWVDRVIRDAFAAFEAALGKPCRSHRFGDRFLNADIVNTLRDLGVRHELTLEPGAPGIHRRAPREPYRPSVTDPLIPIENPAPGGDDLWMIPMTSFNPDPLLPRWGRAARRVRHPWLPRHRPIGLATPWDSTQFWRAAAEHVDQAEVPYLAFVLRSDVATREQAMARVISKLNALESDPLSGRLRFALPDDVAALAADHAIAAKPPRLNETPDRRTSVHGRQ